MSCPENARAPLRCPTLIESITRTLAILPRGRAWPANDGGGTLSRFMAWLAALNNRIPARAEWPPGFVQAGFYSAIAAVFNFIENRLCDLRLEFWCATHKETHAEWMKEYGLPDACDPFPDLCTKVAAIGGTRCEYFSAIAARAGWSITCSDMIFRCHGARAGSRRSLAGRARAGSNPRPLCKLLITVFLGSSPTFTGRRTHRPLAGRLRAGQRLACDPNITPLQCLLERVVPAHVHIEYVTA